jgi:hypothetical protein
MRHVKGYVTSFSFGLALLLAPNRASAVGYEESHSTGKAIVGCGLLGAETVLLIEAAVGVQEPWWYVGGGVVGATGGAIGGYFLEQEDISPRTAMLLLAGGLTLAIPTTVAVLSATAYEPPADYLEDKPPPDEPVADPPQPSSPGAPPASDAAPSGGGASTRAKTTTAAARTRAKMRTRTAVLPPLRLTPPAIVDLSPDMLALRVPALEIRGTYSEKEIAMFGVRQTAEFRVPVLNVVF